MAGQPGRPDELSQLPCDARDLACFVSRRVTSVGICGSDLHWWNESGIGDTQLGRPLVLGHEIAGVVAAGPRSGQPVALDPSVRRTGTRVPATPGWNARRSGTRLAL